MADLDDRIPDVLQRVDLDDLVRRYGGQEARRVGGRVYYHCPSRGHEDHHPSFDTYPSPGGGLRRWACRSQCGRSGDAIELVAWLDGCTTAEAIGRLAAEVGLQRRPMEDRAAALKRRAERDLLVRWCAERGWGPWTVDALGLSVVTDQRGRRRVRFPFRLAGHGVPYWQDRALDGADRIKWLSPQGRRPILYEADRIDLGRQRGAILLAEGVSDVAAIVDVYMSPAVVGVPGVGVWRERWATLFSGLTVFAVADNDEAGERLRARLEADIGPVAAALHQVRVPPDYNDLAAWRFGRDAGEFDEKFMEAVEAAAGDRSWRVNG